MGLMASLGPIALSFPNEKLTYYKESSQNLYSAGTYFLSKNIIEIPFAITISMIFSSITYWMIGLSDTAEQFFIFYSIILLVTLIGNSLGFLIGSIVSDGKSVPFLIPLIVLPFLLFNGFFKNREDLP